MKENPYFLMDDLGGKTTIFGNIYLKQLAFVRCDSNRLRTVPVSLGGRMRKLHLTL